MLQTLGLLRRLLGGAAVRVGAGAVRARAVCAPTQAQARHTAGECPAQKATVPASGSVHLSDSEVPGNGGTGLTDGGRQGPADWARHGTTETRPEPGGRPWLRACGQTGSTGIGLIDAFALSDGSVGGFGRIQFSATTTTINPPATSITVTPGTLPVRLCRGTLPCA